MFVINNYKYSKAAFFKKAALIFILIIFASCGSKRNNIKEVSVISLNNNLRHVCMTASESFYLFSAVAGENGKYLYGNPGISALFASVCKLSLDGVDDYQIVFDDQGQGPGEINNGIGNIFKFGNLFIIRCNYENAPLQLYDNQFNYLMDIRGIKEINDLLFDKEKGEFYITKDDWLAKIHYRGYGKKRKYKNLFWENDDNLKQTPAVCSYAINDTKAVLDKTFLTFYNVKDILIKNGMPFEILKKDSLNVKINFITNEKIVVFNGLSNFFIIYSLNNDNFRKVNINYNSKKLRKIGGLNIFVEQLSFCHSKNYFYFAQNLRDYDKKRNYYRVFQYDLNGNLKSIFNFENLILNAKEKSFICAGMLSTPNDKLVVDEVYFEKNKQGQTEANALKVVYNIPEILKENKKQVKCEKRVLK